MALSTDLSRSPYYDDFNIDKNFYRVLYRPGTSVQTRELNQMQTILQDQIDKFGRHIFTEGSVVEGCSFTFDNAYEYVKIGDTYANGYAFTITDFQDKYVYNTNGLTAIIVNTVAGYIAQDPDLNTLYIKYLSVGTFANGSPQNAFINSETITISGNQQSSNTTAIIGNVSVSSVTNTTGKGYAFTTTQGTIFQKGFFVNVKPQTLIVSKYSNSPTDVSVGFNSIENIVTPEADTSLLDNAAGAPNYAAPGAHRLQLIPTLYTTVTSEITSNTSFFSLVDFKDGVPVSIRNTPEYAALGKQLAQRTYETNGNYIVSPFILSTENKSTTDALYHDYVNLISSPGLGYAEGYRVEFINNSKVNLRKGLDTETISGQVVSANYGNYITVKEYAGDFDTENVTEVELHRVAKTCITDVTFLGIGYSSSTRIGTAYVKAVKYDSGVIGAPDASYKLYLFNIKMDLGETFSSVRSIIRYSSSTVKAVADVILTYNAATDSNIAAVQQPKLDTLIFPLGQQAISTTGFANTQYVYRNKNSAQIQTTGDMSVSLPSVVGAGTESFNVSGSLTNDEIKNFIVIPTATVATTAKTGTVNVTINQSNATSGSSATNFGVDYRGGDFIKIGSNYYSIASIANSTHLTINGIFTATATNSVHAKAFVTGIPIDYTQPNRSVSISGSAATFSLGETLSGTLQTTIYHDILRKNTVAAKKNIIKNALIKINCATHSANSTGPWCLGLSDIVKLNAIYVGSDGVYSNSTTASDQSNLFFLNDRDSDNFYGLCYLKYKNRSFLTNTSTLLIDCDVFTHDRSQGVAFFTANSYPIDDIDLANTNAITTKEIPTYTSFSGLTYDLRDCVDFRFFAANTADPTTVAGSATINPSSTEVIDILASGSYLPTVDTNWQSDVVHYLPRKDLVVVTTKGRLKVIEGVSKNVPKAPLNQKGAMTLGVVNIPPYPSLTAKEAKLVNRYDYSITSTITQNKRFTMSEIGTLASRIDNLEYYTSLNLLEQSTASMLIKNSTTGLNRFKNGILVDPFAGHDIGDTLDANYQISIDTVKKELRPKFYQRQESFVLNENLSTGVVQAGALVLLDYYQELYIAQQYASKYRNCIEGNIYVFKGDVNLMPNYMASPSLKTNPDVVNNLDLSQNWINLKNAWGTQWGNWQTVSASSATSVGEKTLSGSTTDNAGNIIQSFNQRSVTTNVTTQQQTGTELSVSGYNDTKMNLGTFVQDISIQPYIPSMRILFSSVSMKPGARVYAYFNNIKISDWCKPTNQYYTENPIGPDYNAMGDPLIVNSDGSIFGIFIIPPNKFQSTELTFMLCDVDNLTTGFNAITTQSTGTFYATNLSIAKGSSVLNTRDVTISAKEVTQQQTLVTSTTGNQSSVTVIPGAIITPFITRPPIITQAINIISPWIPPDENGNIISSDSGNWGTYDGGGGGGGGGGACSGYGGYGGYGCGCDSTMESDPGDDGEGDDGDGEGDGGDGDGGDGDGGDGE